MDLNEIRNEINAIDDALCSLFVKRMQLSGEVAEVKRQSGKKVFDPARENAIIERLTQDLSSIDAEAVAELYQSIFAISRKKQHRLLQKDSELTQTLRNLIKNPTELPDTVDVACQGTDGAYSSIACRKLFANPSTLFFENFESVFKSVKFGLSKYGVLPFENSIYGSVVEVYEKLCNSDVYVVKSVKLPIHHTLLVKKGTILADIREIYSHPQAIGQCGQFLGSLKNVCVTKCLNTALAARMVAESDRTDVAAIASEICAENFGLEILKKDIQNSSTNYTYFYCISKDLEVLEGANKAAFMFNVANEKGSLADVLSKFSLKNINLTKIESQPIAGRDFEFMFYAEADITGKTEEILSLFTELEEELSFFRFIGIYPEV